MGFFIKLLKEINGAENEKFITLALVLGLINGFLPFFNVFSFLILIIALLVRIPFGLYLGSWGVFSVAGYFLDPVFAKIGYAVLTLPVLNPVFEFLYNLPLMRYSGFNNTVVMGGLVSGLFLGFVLYFVLNATISKYRDVVFAYLKKYKILSWIVPSEIKKRSFIRVSGLFLLLGIGAVVSLFFIFLFDPILKNIIEYTASKTFRTSVKIEKLHTSLKDMNVHIEGVGFKKTKIDNIDLKLSLYYLLWKKADILNLTVKNVHYNDSVADLLARHNTEKASSKKYKFNINIPKPEQILNAYHLKTEEKIKKLKEDYENYVVYVNALKRNAKEVKNKINDIKQKIRKLQYLSKNVKDVNGVNEIITNVKSIEKEINALNSSFKEEKRKLSEMNMKLKKDLKEIKTASKEDYEFLAKKYNLLKEGKYYKFAETFIKPEINSYIKQALGVYEYIKPYINSSDKTKNEYVRSKGMYIKFKDRIKYPDIVIKKSEIGVILKDVNASFILKDVSDNQKILNKTAVVKIKAAGKYFKRGNAAVEYLNSVKFSVNISKAYLNKIKLNSLVLKKVVADIKINGIFEQNKIDMKIYSVLIPKIMAFDNNKYVNDVVRGIKKVVFKILVKGTLDNYTLSINSNLDKELSKYINKKIDAEISKNKIKLQKVLNKKINEQIKNTGFGSVNVDVGDVINDYQAQLDSLKKELRKYSEKELKKQILKKGLKQFINF